MIVNYELGKKYLFGGAEKNHEGPQVNWPSTRKWNSGPWSIEWNVNRYTATFLLSMWWDDNVKIYLKEIAGLKSLKIVSSGGISFSSDEASGCIPDIN
jgi:hypothetical protein